MEHEESGWILEFLVRQPSIDDKTLNNLIGVLPIPNNNNNLRFKKTLILRKLETHVEKGTIFQLLGPPFLELACEMILSDDGLRKIMGLDDDDAGNGVGREVDVNDKRKGTGGVGFDTRIEDGAKNVVGRDVDVNDKIDMLKRHLSLCC